MCRSHLYIESQVSVVSTANQQDTLAPSPHQDLVLHFRLRRLSWQDFGDPCAILPPSFPTSCPVLLHSLLKSLEKGLEHQMYFFLTVFYDFT